MAVHHVIYVPGLGDSRSYGQDSGVAGWKKYGLQGVYLPLGWADKEDFAPKLKRLLAKIDELSTDDNKVSLVGVSAGASAVLNAYVLRPKLNAVVLIAGKVNNPESIGKLTYQINPAFRQSVFGLKDSLPKLGSAQRRRILSIHPLADGTVPVADTRIPGAHEKTVPVIGHRLSIAFTVIFKGRLIAKFIKSQSVK